MASILFKRLPDGSTRCLNPLVGEEVWTVPGRGARPITNRPRHEVRPLKNGNRDESTCDFCPANIVHTPAEKSRLLEDGSLLENPSPERSRQADALFRRVPNLYEIVSWDFWQKVHGLQLTQGQASRRDAWLQDPVGQAHLRQVMGEKLKHLGQRLDTQSMPVEQLSKLVEAFFGGSHDLIVAGHHYRQNASSTEEVMSSGDLSPRDHLRFLDYAFQSADAIEQENPKVAWTSVFQNWRSPAGASFDHLHKQILGMDSLPPGVIRRQQVEKENPDFFNKEIVALAKKENLALAENEHALAMVEPGHPYPCLMFYSKSKARRWLDLSADEKRDLSELLRAAHAGMGGSLPVNEEWLGADREGPALPLQLALKWRINTPAGLEGGARVTLNPLDPHETRERALEGMKKHLENARFGDNCHCEAGSLRYLD